MEADPALPTWNKKIPTYPLSVFGLAVQSATDYSTLVYWQEAFKPVLGS